MSVIKFLGYLPTDMNRVDWSDLSHLYLHYFNLFHTLFNFARCLLGCHLRRPKQRLGGESNIEGGYYEWNIAINRKNDIEYARDFFKFSSGIWNSPQMTSDLFSLSFLRWPQLDNNLNSRGFLSSKKLINLFCSRVSYIINAAFEMLLVKFLNSRENYYCKKMLKLRVFSVIQFHYKEPFSGNSFTFYN